MVLSDCLQQSSCDDKFMLTIPTFFTLLRIFLIPLFVTFFYLPVWWGHLAGAIVFICAGITDWLDGYLARSLRQTSSLGAFLDPVADKLVVAVALILIVGEPTLHYLTIPAAVIVGREIVVSALREWMAEIGKRTSMAVTFIAKIKTTIQMIAVILLLISRSIVNDWITGLGYIFLYGAAALTLWTMVIYIKAAWPEFKTASLFK